MEHATNKLHHVIHFLFSLHFILFRRILYIIIVIIIYWSGCCCCFYCMSLRFICFSCISALSAFKEAMFYKLWPVQIMTTTFVYALPVCSRCVTILQINKRCNAHAFFWKKCRLIKYLTASSIIHSHKCTKQLRFAYVDIKVGRVVRASKIEIHIDAMIYAV